MPVYEFYCKNCGHEVTEIQSYDDPIPECSKCEAGIMSRAISRSAVRTQGAGIYSMDHSGVKDFGELE